MEAQTQKKYVVTPELKAKFICLLLIHEIINFQKYFTVVTTGNDDFIADYLKLMLKDGLIQIKETIYIPTDKGRKYLVNFYDKYCEYLKMFDIYCAVDLEKGEFSFSSANSPMSDEEWDTFINDKRFSDVRIAVAEFKKMDPMEIVFMSFLNEKRFLISDLDYGWQYKITRDDIWNEIADICNTAITLEYLKENDVIQDIVAQGSKIVIDLLKLVEDDEKNMASQAGEDADEEVVTTTTTTEEYVDTVEMPYYGYSYYEPYYNPFYISPIWLVPFLF